MFRTRYQLEVNYKTGIQKRFWVYKFTITHGEWTWISVSDSNKPIVLGVDEVESVWQVGYKRFGFI